MSDDDLLAQATENHRAGDLLEARRLYQQLVARTAADPLATFRLGLLDLQEGNLDASLTRIDQAIAADPLDPRYPLGRGAALLALGRWAEAAAAYRRILERDPDSADARFSLGAALQSLGDRGAAIEAYEAALVLQPDRAEACTNLGMCRQLGGDLVEAERLYRRALVLQPHDAPAMSNLGALLQSMCRADEAVELLRAAASLEPAAAQHAVNLGAALCGQRKFFEAEGVLRAVLERSPGNVEAAYNLGNALHGLGRLREAKEQYRQATAGRPDHVDAFNNLGNVHRELGELTLAVAAYENAIAMRPDFVVALNNLGCLLRTQGRTDEAEAALRRGIVLDPDLPALYENLGSVLKDAGSLSEAIDCLRLAVGLGPNDAAAHGSLAYALSFDCSDAQAILDECRRWNARHAARLHEAAPRPAIDRSAGRRLRIGYVSADFREHCQSLFTIPLLSHHDHAAFEIFCYGSVERPDDVTRRIAGLADVWRDVRLLDDAALGELVRADRIDVLVDLTMHMAAGRPLLFARKPAPLQIAWLAYPGTTGMAAMDVRFTDWRLDPPGYDDHYSERSVRLPDAFWCYDPLTAEPVVNALPALARGHVTFGCLNNPCKLTDRTLSLWRGVFSALPEARLVLMAPPGRHREHLLHRLMAQGIAADRVEFVSFRPRADYLRSYHGIDIGLDTLPYNGHTTSLDALWMGVPVVTRVGQTSVGRGGLSQLFQLDLLELAAESDAGFVAAAVALAGDLPRLASLRQQLRQRLESSPLMDGERFARNVEAAYRDGFRACCETGSP